MRIVDVFSSRSSVGTLSVACLALAGTLIAPALAGAQTPAPGAVTFTKDVAPILQRSCQNCHRPGEIAPMSLLSYQEVRPWARAIKTRVASREMPPWHVDKTIGITKFKDDPSLSDEEIETIVKWVDAGAPQGNPADMPPPRQFLEAGAWQIGTPDLVIKFPTYVVPAAGPDLYGELLRGHSDRSRIATSKPSRRDRQRAPRTRSCTTRFRTRSTGPKQA